MGPNPASSLQFFIPASPNGEGPFHLSEAPLWWACTSVDAARFPEIQQGAGWTQYCLKLRRPQDGAAVLTVTFLLGHTPRDTSRDCCCQWTEFCVPANVIVVPGTKGVGWMSCPPLPRLSSLTPPPVSLPTLFIGTEGEAHGRVFGMFWSFLLFVIKII